MMLTLRIEYKYKLRLQLNVNNLFKMAQFQSRFITLRFSPRYLKNHYKDKDSYLSGRVQNSA